MGNFVMSELLNILALHVEYYLMHMLNDARTWKRLCAMGIDRWLEEKKADGSMVSPGVFVPVLERYGFVTDLDRYVWELAAKQLAAIPPALLRSFCTSGRDNMQNSSRMIPAAGSHFFMISWVTDICLRMTSIMAAVTAMMSSVLTICLGGSR